MWPHMPSSALSSLLPGVSARHVPRCILLLPVLPVCSLLPASLPASIPAEQQQRHLARITRQQLEQLPLMLRGTGGTPSPQTGEKGSSGDQWPLPAPCSIPHGRSRAAPPAHKMQKGSKEQLHLLISEGGGEFYCLTSAKAPGSDAECPILGCPETS